MLRIRSATGFQKLTEFETPWSAMILLDHRCRRFSHRCKSPSGTSSAFSAKTR